MLTFNHDFALRRDHDITTEEPQHLQISADSEQEVQRKALVRAAQVAGGCEASAQ